MSYINAHHDYNTGDVTVWERKNGKRQRVKYPAPYYFYVDEKGKEIFNLPDDTPTKTGLMGNATVYKRTFLTYADMQAAQLVCKREKVKTFEADISPDSKILSQHYQNVELPELHITYLDIEIDYDPGIGFAGISNPYAPINSISYYNTWTKKTKLVAVPPPDWDFQLDETLFEIADIVLVNDEYELLKTFLTDTEDCDGYCGWNSDFFDIPYIALRLEAIQQKTGKFPANPTRLLCFDKADKTRYRTVTGMFGQEQTTIDLYGRLRIDYLQLFKKFEMNNRPSYKLESISKEILPEMSKLEYEGTLSSLYRKNFNFFIRYNIRDVECLVGFEKKLGYVALANIMYHESTGAFSNINGTIRLAEGSLINYCHNVLDKVVPDKESIIFDEDYTAKGAFVLDPKVGMHEWIGSIDVNSLYPSAIRSINISPEMLIGQFLLETLAFEEIHKRSSVPLAFMFEDTKRVVSHPANEWREILETNKWAISGFGTVFSQEHQGMMPAVLESWYKTRKKYQKLKKEAKDPDMIAFYDRMQYCYKIKLNSLYGALLNQHFKFFDRRLGESTTGTGRAVLKFMCGKTNEILTEVVDINGEAIIYGDTDSVYFKTFANNIEQAIEIGDGVADIVNDSFQPFMRDAFLCQPTFDNIIVAGREVISSRGIFVTPKHYLLKVVDKEGKRVNEMKIMGLDIKKTTIPYYIQKQLVDLLERFLDGEEWKVIAREVLVLKNTLEKEVDIYDLGLPKGVNKVEHYTSELSCDANARLPGHVRAAILYNRCVQQYKDTESPSITSGNKIKVFYLEQPIGKFKSIALPVDIEQVPQWFYEHIQVSKYQQILRLVDNPLDNILKAIGKESPTKQSVFLEDTLEF